MTKDELIQDLKNNVYCRLQPSPINGIGIFAIRDIPKGVNPFRGCRMPTWKKFRREEIFSNEKILDEVKDFVKAVYPLKKNAVYLPNHSLNTVDISYFLNHSDAPNAAFIKEQGDFIALRTIKKGEELFSDYRTYSD